LDKQNLKNLVCLILLPILIAACSASYGNLKNNKFKLKPNHLKIEHKIAKASNFKDESGALNTEVLPWENEKNFLNLQKQNNVSVRMAAFKTVLHDPLPGEEHNVSTAANAIAGTIILPDKTFSQNRTAGPYTKERGFEEGPTYQDGKLVKTIGGGVCKVATTLYNVAALADIKIIERHAHSMIAPYVPPGQDAAVYYGALDFKFKNNKNYPIMLWAKNDENKNTLYMAIYGRENPPKVQWHHKILRTIKTYKLYHENPDLPFGTNRLVFEGYNGYVVKSWLTIEMPDGTKKEKILGTDYYRPMPSIMEIGTKGIE